MSDHEELIKRISGPEWDWDGDVTWSWEPNGRHEKPYAMLSIVTLGDSEPFYGLTIWHAHNQVYNAYSYNAALVTAIIDLAGPANQPRNGGSVNDPETAETAAAGQADGSETWEGPSK